MPMVMGGKKFMIIEKWIGFIILILFIDITVSIGLYLTWIRKKTNNGIVPNDFPYNATKKQVKIWWIVWIIAICFNLVIYTLLSWIFAKVDPNNNITYSVAFFISSLGYAIILLIIYALIKNIVKGILRKR
jgi:hypothetical protein